MEPADPAQLQHKLRQQRRNAGVPAAAAASCHAMRADNDSPDGDSKQTATAVQAAHPIPATVGQHPLLLPLTLGQHQLLRLQPKRSTNFAYHQLRGTTDPPESTEGS